MMGLFAVALTGAAVSLDRLCFQTMICRPIVCAPVLAFILGQGAIGLVIGAWLELMWIDRLPLGNYVPPAASYLALIATGAVVMAGTTVVDMKVVIPSAMALLLPVAYVGQKLDVWIFTHNEHYAQEAEEAAQAGDEGKIARLHLLALVRAVVIVTLFITVAAGVGGAILNLIVPAISDVLRDALITVYALFPLILLAMVLNVAYEREDLKFFYLAGQSVGDCVSFKSGD